MRSRLQRAWIPAFCAGISLGIAGPLVAQAGGPVTTIQRVDVCKTCGNFELEIKASRPVTPQTQVITGPDRLVIDFPNAVPGPGLHAIAVKTAQVKGVRTGLFEASPPVARVVVDLNSPQPYQIVPSGKSVIVKISENGKLVASTPPSMAVLPLVTASQPAAAAPPEPVKPQPPPLRVEFSNGKLSVWTEHATLGEVLRAVARQTGATLSMPPAADREQVIANLGPGPSREVISTLLNGVPFNVLLLGSGRDLSQVTSIVLTPRGSATADMPANYSPAPVQDATPEPPPEVEPQPEVESQPEVTPPPAPSGDQENPQPPPPVPDPPQQ